MFIEDIIISAVTHGARFSTWNSGIIESFRDQLLRGLALSEKQSLLAVKVLKKHARQISDLLNKDISNFLETPQFKLGVRKLNHNKTITLNRDLGNIRVEFPYDEKIILKIQSTRSKLNSVVWDRDKKAWFFSLDESSIEFLIGLSQEFGFTVDDELKNYGEQIQEVKNSPNKYQPLLTKSGSHYELQNAPRFCPTIKSENLIESLFTARKLGIYAWDEGVDNEIKSMNLEKPLMNFIYSSTKTVYQVFLNDAAVNDIACILKHLTPCLFIIPGGSELEKLKISLDLLATAGIASEETSVLFRLPSTKSADFNEFVRANKLNSPINEKTKAVFISGKITKPLIESKVNFNLILNFSPHTVHYTVRDHIRNHHNIIHLTDREHWGKIV
jgi:hypothetical protein